MVSVQGEVEQISLMKPKVQGAHDEGFLEYLEDIIGTNQYVEKIEEAQRQWVSFFNLSLYSTFLFWRSGIISILYCLLLNAVTVIMPWICCWWPVNCGRGMLCMTYLRAVVCRWVPYFDNTLVIACLWKGHVISFHWLHKPFCCFVSNAYSLGKCKWYLVFDIWASWCWAQYTVNQASLKNWTKLYTILGSQCWPLTFGFESVYDFSCWLSHLFYCWFLPQLTSFYSPLHRASL